MIKMMIDDENGWMIMMMTILMIDVWMMMMDWQRMNVNGDDDLRWNIKLSFDTAWQVIPS